MNGQVALVRRTIAVPLARPSPRWFMWAIGLCAPFLWVALVWYSQADERAFMALTRGDGWVEDAEVVLLLLGSVLSGSLAWRLRRAKRGWWALVYSVVALGLFWAAGDETSWSHRICQTHLPSWWASIDMQRETNLHNLQVCRKCFERWFDRAVIAATILSFVAWRRQWLRSGRWQAELWVPHPSLLPTWLCQWSYGWMRMLYRWHYHARAVSPVVTRLHEGREVFFDSLVAAFLLGILSRLRQRQEDSTLRSRR